MKNTIMRKITFAALGLSIVASLAGCGKKKENNDDPNAAVRKEVVTFINEDLVSISADREEAVATYNSYTASTDSDPQAFLGALNKTCIPKMQTYVDKLTAIETKTPEVTNLKNLHLQGAQKQLDAMNKVATAISEMNPQYLAEADSLIAESKSFYEQYETEVQNLASTCNITINGTFTDSTNNGAIQELPADNGAIQELPADNGATQ